MTLTYWKYTFPTPPFVCGSENTLTVYFDVLNKGTQTINSLNYEITVNGQNQFTSPQTMTVSIPSGERHQQLSYDVPNFWDVLRTQRIRSAYFS